MRTKRATISAYGDIMKTPELTSTQKVVWGLYRAFDYHGKGAWPGDKTIARHMGVSSRTVQRARAALLRLGYLKQTLRGPRPASYLAVVPESKPLPPRPKGGPPMPEECQDETVRKLEVLVWMHQNGEDIPDDMADEYGVLLEEVEDDVWAGLISGEPWKVTAARAKLHQRLPDYCRRANEAWSDSR